MAADSMLIPPKMHRKQKVDVNDRQEACGLG